MSETQVVRTYQCPLRAQDEGLRDLIAVFVRGRLASLPIGHAR